MGSGLDGGLDVIDLTAESSCRLRSALQEHLPQTCSVNQLCEAKAAPDGKENRPWAKLNDYEVADRGRFHRDLIQV